MRRVRILYAVLLLVLAAFYVLYIDPLPLVMLMVTAALPVILGIGTVWVHFAAKCTISVQSVTCTAGETVPVILTVQNRSPLFFSRVHATVRLSHRFGHRKETLHLQFPLRPNNTTRLTFQFSAEDCGEVRITLRRIRIYDLLLLTGTNLKRTDSTVILTVLPRLLPLPLETSAPPADQPESERFSDKPGDDPSEVFGIREYQPGDAVSRMHWKLSSRSDTMFVKEFSSPVEKNCLLLCEYRYPDGRRPRMKDAQTLLTVLYSLASEIISREHQCVICYADRDTGRLMTVKPDSVEALVPTFRLMLEGLTVMQADLAVYRDALGGTVYSSVTVLTNAPASLLPDFVTQELTANQRNVLLISDSSEEPQLPPETAFQQILPEEPVIRHLNV